MSRRLRSMEGDYGSGRSFITSPVAIYFSVVMSNHEVIHIEFRASMEEC